MNMVLGEVEETVTTMEVDEETFEEMIKVPPPPLPHAPRPRAPDRVPDRVPHPTTTSTRCPPRILIPIRSPSPATR